MKIEKIIKKVAKSVLVNVEETLYICDICNFSSNKKDVCENHINKHIENEILLKIEDGILLLCCKKQIKFRTEFGSLVKNYIINNIELLNLRNKIQYNLERLDIDEYSVHNPGWYIANHYIEESECYEYDKISFENIKEKQKRIINHIKDLESNLKEINSLIEKGY